MRLIPKPIAESITFFQAHLDPWSAHADEIGTSTAAVDDLVAKTQATQAKYSAQQEALQAARAATLELHLAAKEMLRAGSDIIKSIRARGSAEGNSIYSLAQIPAPQDGSPLPPPGMPEKFSVELLPDGSLVLRWKCRNPAGSSGTIYQISRCLAPSAAAAEFTFIGSTGSKQFIDSTLPAGGAPGGTIAYRIVAVRSTASGTPNQFNVNFGGASQSAMSINVGKRTQLAA